MKGGVGSWGKAVGGSAGERGADWSLDGSARRGKRKAGGARECSRDAAGIREVEGRFIYAPGAIFLVSFEASGFSPTHVLNATTPTTAVPRSQTSILEPRRRRAEKRVGRKRIGHPTNSILVGINFVATRTHFGVSAGNDHLLEEARGHGRGVARFDSGVAVARPKRGDLPCRKRAARAGGSACLALRCVRGVGR